MTSDLKDKAVLVFGSSTGIGAAVAKGFARCGARVAVHGNASREPAQAVLTDIQAAGGEAVLFMGDVTQAGVVEDIVAKTVAAFGRLDILINNAGSLVRRANVVDYEDSLLDEVIDLNVRSTLAACRAAVPHFRTQGGGCIINTGSIAAHNGGAPGAGLYAGAKSFIHALTKTLCLEYSADNVRVNAVSPGVILTPFHDRFNTPEKLENVRKTIPLMRLGTPEECVGTYLYLASEEMSGYVTGQVIDVNGGQLRP